MVKKFITFQRLRLFFLLLSVGLGLLSCQAFNRGIQNQIPSALTFEEISSPTPEITPVTVTPTKTIPVIRETPLYSPTTNLFIGLSLTIPVVYDADFVKPITESLMLDNPANDVYQVDWYDTYSGLLAASSEGIIIYSGEMLTRTRSIWEDISFRSVAYLSRLDVIAGGGLDSRIYWWDLTDDQFIGATEGHRLGVGSLLLNPAGSLLSSGSDDGRVYVWNVNSVSKNNQHELHRVFEFSPTAGRITSVSISPNGQLIAVGGERKVVVWLIPTGEERGELTDFRDKVHALDFSPGGNSLAIADGSGTVELWDVTTLTRTLVINSGLPGVITAMDYHPAGSLLAIGNSQGFVQLWYLPLRPFTPYSRVFLSFDLVSQQDRIVDLAFNVEGNRLASVSSDGTIKVWDVSASLRVTPPSSVDIGTPTIVPTVPGPTPPTPTSTPIPGTTPIPTATSGPYPAPSTPTSGPYPAPTQGQVPTPTSQDYP